MKTFYKYMALAILSILVCTHSAFGLEFLYQSGEGFTRRDYYRAKNGRVFYAMQFGASLTLPVPAYDWRMGCSPTAAGMVMGYYDINGYNGESYDDLVLGGDAEMSNFGVPGAIANQMIASTGHDTDFYVSPGTTGDPNPNSTRAFDCLADFMGTSQWGNCSNSDGGTKFYFWSGAGADDPFTAADAFSAGVWNCSGAYGIGEYLNFAGYGYTDIYNQRIYNASTAPDGFTWAQYKAEIDAGRPVLIHVEGHSMTGIGYSDTNNTIYLHDTWVSSIKTMTWGGSYPYGSSQLAHLSVTCIEIEGGSQQVAPPVAGFTATPRSGSAPLLVNFTDLSTNSPTGWEWDLNGDGNPDRFVQHPTFTYTAAGQYTVRLKVTNQGGDNTLVKTFYITVVEQSCLSEPIWNAAESNPAYSRIKDAYASAGGDDMLLIQGGRYSEGGLEFVENKEIQLRGGFDCGFSGQSMTTTVENALVISNGSVVVENIVID